MRRRGGRRLRRRRSRLQWLACERCCHCVGECGMAQLDGPARRLHSRSGDRGLLHARGGLCRCLPGAVCTSGRRRAGRTAQRLARRAIGRSGRRLRMRLRRLPIGGWQRGLGSWRSRSRDRPPTWHHGARSLVGGSRGRLSSLLTSLPVFAWPRLLLEIRERLHWSCLGPLLLAGRRHLSRGSIRCRRCRLHLTLRDQPLALQLRQAGVRRIVGAVHGRTLGVDGSALVDGLGHE